MKIFKQAYSGAYGVIKHYVVPTDPNKRVLEKLSGEHKILVTAGEERELSYYENLSEADLTKHEIVDFVPEVSKPAAVVVTPPEDEDNGDEATITYNSNLPGDNKIKDSDVNNDQLASSSDSLTSGEKSVIDEVKVGGDTITTGNDPQ